MLRTTNPKRFEHFWSNTAHEKQQQMDAKFSLVYTVQVGRGSILCVIISLQPRRTGLYLRGRKQCTMSSAPKMPLSDCNARVRDHGAAAAPSYKVIPGVVKYL
ncbi:hypothetical protein BAUCODRAFT_352698 [Baudoinia panamericana UAMH 10762]|uniref:Uncharacterized protein n=1 Tax=Baudoinia panamericana (strain UAMH 10762) TaxID=717646 RepID=M2MSI7_BAUPA|nr:uncharacterized protein BAUCODRAFT_352698 [Baudoinia panamericana UAMH 10762]EMC99841.1 hypothetical protein BAUCODRAFT_352698 [Baudoinia panamericana UAMH 10762]